MLNTFASVRFHLLALVAVLPSALAACGAEDEDCFPTRSGFAHRGGEESSEVGSDVDEENGDEGPGTPEDGEEGEGAVPPGENPGDDDEGTNPGFPGAPDDEEEDEEDDAQVPAPPPQPAPEPADQCAGIPQSGACDGDVAHWCLEGEAFTFDCASEGSYCDITEDGLMCVPNAYRVIDEELPVFECSGATGTFNLRMGNGYVFTIDGNESVVEGTYATYPMLAFNIPGRVNGSVTSTSVALDMLVAFETADASCQAFSYAYDEGFDRYFNCGATWFTSGYITYSDIELFADGSAIEHTTTETTFDVWTGRNYGLYRLDGQNIQMVFFSDDTTIAYEGILNADGTLTVPSFTEPNCWL